MAIDKCPYNFTSFARRILPGYLRHMRRSMRRPLKMAELAPKGVGVRALLKKIDRDADFPGCYVFVSRGRPIYVGISRTVLQRLSQHIKGRTRAQASLAYRMARTLKRTRRKTDLDMLFRNRKRYLGRLKVAFVEIDNALERYIFEAYCSMALDTSQWNTFETH
jgi:hypothetical protein